MCAKICPIKKVIGKKRSEISQFIGFLAIFQDAIAFFLRKHAARICCRVCRVLPICVFSGQSGDSNFLAILVKHPIQDRPFFVKFFRLMQNIRR